MADKKETVEEHMTDTRHDADVAFIKSLAELLRENDLTELEVKREYGEDDALNVRVSRAAPAPVAAFLTGPPDARRGLLQEPPALYYVRTARNLGATAIFARC